ncbi:MAG: hypothetical protein B6229_07755 [Spirochaetaceae bacterium 4572_7]|nr:MAG: hypothetical protein B6229_07755 [Spirochaetaceae bacterium 4572_7]
MEKTSAIIHNEKGIHVRPSGLIFKAIMGYSGTIIVTKDGVDTEINDIISILTLGLGHNCQIEISVNGENEKEMIGILKGLFEKSYEFEEQ